MSNLLLKHNDAVSPAILQRSFDDLLCGNRGRTAQIIDQRVTRRGEDLKSTLHEERVLACSHLALPGLTRETEPYRFS